MLEAEWGSNAPIRSIFSGNSYEYQIPTCMKCGNYKNIVLENNLHEWECMYCPPDSNNIMIEVFLKNL